MASQNLNIKVKLDFDETSLKNLNLGTVRVDPDVNHFKSKLRSALNGNFKITPKINTKGISNQLNNIKNDMREFRNAAKDPIKTIREDTIAMTGIYKQLTTKAIYYLLYILLLCYYTVIFCNGYLYCDCYILTYKDL